MDCNKKYMKAAQCHASMLKIEPQAFGIASMFFKVDGEICWLPTYFDNSQYLILTMYPISWASCQKVYNPVSKWNLPASRSLSPPALVLFVLSDPARSHSDNVATAIWFLSCSGEMFKTWSTIWMLKNVRHCFSVGI